MSNATDKWSTRFPADYQLGDLTDSDLADWRDMCRSEEAGGYIVPHTDKPIDARNAERDPILTNECPSSWWRRGHRDLTAEDHRKLLYGPKR